jgi:hypothetical protein
MPRETNRFLTHSLTFNTHNKKNNRQQKHRLLLFFPNPNPNPNP